MDKLPMCRICLAENVKMHVITNTLYQEIYQRLTMMPFETKDSRPIQACYVCCARLRNCYELRKNCLQSEELFTQMLQSSAPKLDELLESITSKRLSIKQLVFQIDIVPEVRASSDSEDDMKCTEYVQVKIESEHVEDVVDVECTAEKRSYTNELPIEEDPLSTTKDPMMMIHDKDDVAELPAVHRITGGGPQRFFPPDDILDRVAALLGTTGKGLGVMFGGDAESSIGDGGVSSSGTIDIVPPNNAVVPLMDNSLSVTCNSPTTSMDYEATPTTRTDNEMSNNGTGDGLVKDVPIYTHIPNIPEKMNFKSSGVKRKLLKPDEGRLRNMTPAEYFKTKKELFDVKTEIIKLQNEKLKLEIRKLKGGD